MDALKRTFEVLPETDQIYPTWERLVRDHNVSGKPSHDAHLVAAMLVHGVRRVLTFDRTGFSRFPAVQAIHPADHARG
ncbi:hypothetical protein F183_A08860 [Bryobacterales bacterium F-183]|nr:hypothetical protein F183_A08860 [Bryobacterales bacterium F-183]